MCNGGIWTVWRYRTMGLSYSSKTYMCNSIIWRFLETGSQNTEAAIFRKNIYMQSRNIGISQSTRDVLGKLPYSVITYICNDGIWAFGCLIGHLGVWFIFRNNIYVQRRNMEISKTYMCNSIIWQFFGNG